MRSTRIATLAALALVSAVLGAAESRAAEDYLSPIDVVASPDGTMLYVAAATGGKVLCVKTADGQVAGAYDADGPLTGIAISADGKKLYVTRGEAAGALYVMDAATGAIEKTIAVGHTPVSPVSAPDGRVYVCNRFDDEVGVVDPAAGEQVSTIAVLREPFAAAVTPDGKKLVVANHLPAGSSDGSYVAAKISVVDLATGEVANVQMPNGSTGLRGIAISPDGKYAYASHILARYQLPTTQLDRGWMNTNAVSVVDLAGAALLNTFLLDNIDRGAANPWGVAVTADGKFLCVTHAGTHEISVIDREGLHQRLADAAAGKKVTEVSDSADDVPNDLAFLVGIRRRLKLAGKGPRGLTVADGKAYAAEYFADSLGVATLAADAPHKPTSLDLGGKKDETLLRRGERGFNDADFCFQGWQSCATCHPDVRTDGLNWDLLNDGIGNPRNTKSLLLSHETPPVMITGVRAKAEVAVRAGMRFIQFAVRPEEDAEAIDAYLKSLQPVPSPHLVNGQLSESAKRGEAIYQSAGCAHCHPAPHYTDMKMYDVGTGTERDVESGLKFDTPALIEVWRTAPYLVRGQAATMQQVLEEYNQDNKHGRTEGLTEQEINDLAEYVLSL